MFLNQDFRFAILATIDYTSNRLFWSRLSHFSHPERLRRPGRGPPLDLQIACSLTRISVLPSWPPSIIHPPASFGAVCLIFPIPNDSGGPGGGHLWLFPVGKNLEVPHFKRVLRHLSVRPPTPSPGPGPATP